MKSLRFLLVIIFLILAPSITLAQSDPCTPASVLESFQVAALSDNLDTWIQRYQDSECPNKVKSAARLLVQGYQRMVSNAPLLEDALVFDGQNDFIEIPHSSALSLRTYTVEAWVRPATVQRDWTQILSKEANPNGARNYGLFLMPNQTRVNASFQENMCRIWKVAETSDALPLSTWSHVAMTYNGSALILYVNGHLVKMVNVADGVCQNAEPIRIGGGIAAHRTFNGQIAEVRIWNYARTVGEIQADMNRRLSGTEEGLVGYWPLDNVEGGIAEDLAGVNDGVVYR